jgi:hypothetical protein
LDAIHRLAEIHPWDIRQWRDARSKLFAPRETILDSISLRCTIFKFAYDPKPLAMVMRQIGKTGDCQPLCFRK